MIFLLNIRVVKFDSTGGNMNRVYGYARVSTATQNIERQLRNITAAYPDCYKVYQESYTGTKVDRPEFSKLLKEIQAGDTIVFDSVSRMSRTADEGFALYERLFNSGLNLVFLKEPHINTDTYKQAIESKLQIAIETGDSATNELMKTIIEALDKYILALAKKQIMLAFEQSEKEVTDLHQRTKEGIETARRAGKQIGAVKGQKNTVHKAELIKALIKKYSREFNGNNSDLETMAILETKTVTFVDSTGKQVTKTAKLAQNTYYKYKKDLKTEQAQQQH